MNALDSLLFAITVQCCHFHGGLFFDRSGVVLTGLEKSSTGSLRTRGTSSFLRHAHIKTLEVYVEADLEMKRRALESTPSPVKAGSPVRRHTEDLLHWLEQLSP